MNENKIIYPLPTTLSERNTADDQVHLVEMNPMDMVELILSKTTESIYSGSSANSGIGRAFTLPCFSGTDARDERCESLVRSILGDQIISTDIININTVGSAKLNTSGRDTCKSRQDKAEMFQQIMSNWLLKNFTNPFPDNQSLRCLAMHLIQAQCVDFSENDVNTGNKRGREEYQEGLMIMTIKKIETYLVNVRMRKWRKCIEEAFDRRRPAQYLLEDSICLYEGKELRTLDRWKPDEVFAPHDRYSLPLKAWKRKKKVFKAAKKRNSTTTGEDVPETVGGLTPKRIKLSPMELKAGDGLIELAKGIKIMTTSDKKASPMDTLVKVGGMGVSPVNVGLGVGPLEDEARRKMLKGTFFGSPDGE